MKAIDLFAGWGGFTTGAQLAGVRVVWASNHWEPAVSTHRLNHPETVHVCQDLRQADWSALPRYDLLLASPACQGHSEASQPKRARDPRFHDPMRATAWAVVDCAEVTRPRAFVVENVKEFREWPLYPLWLEALRTLGYHVTETLAVASRFGVPQRRTRLLVVGSRRAPVTIRVPDAAEPAFGPYIDWKAAGWRPISAARPGASARMRLASERLGTALVQHTSGHRGISLGEPIRTITTKDQWCLVRGREYRWLSLREIARAQGFPDSYTWDPSYSRAVVVKGFGNAVPVPMAAGIVEQVARAA